MIILLIYMKTKKIKWTPAENEGKKVPFRYTVPVSFNLNLPKNDNPKPTTTNPAPSNQVFDIVETMPQYAGCEAAINDSIDCTFLKVVNHIKANLKYPEEALKNKVQGQVVVEFVIALPTRRAAWDERGRTAARSPS